MTDLVVLFDVDNTLLDNDGVLARLRDRVSALVGPDPATRFWEIYEQVRAETDHVDFPETTARFARECSIPDCLATVRKLLYEFPFRDYLFPGSLQAISHVASFATPVIVSDGDAVFQRYKITAAGLDDAVQGRVLVYVHKEKETQDIRHRYPAGRYAAVDDKERILAAMKEVMGDDLTTLFVRQGKYAHDPMQFRPPEPDITLKTIGGLLELSAEQLAGRAKASPA